MTSLRTRIAVLLVLAIVSVVGLATFTASRALQPPSPEATMEPLARQLHVLARLAENNRAAALEAGLVLQDGPKQGVSETGMTRFLGHAIGRTGAGRNAMITRAADSPVLTASVELASGEWLVMDVPDFRPSPTVKWVLAGWALLIIIGATMVSLFATSKITRPLEMLESAAGRIGMDGLLTHIPETGSAEVRATAHALNQLSSRLKSAVESRMRLVAAAGHDLRTPMTRMRLRAEFVTDPQEREKWFADLEELDAIADSAIRLVREEIGEDGTETVELGRLVGEVATELRDLGYGIGPPPTGHACVAAKPLALKRAVRNLLINAATHGGGASMTLERIGERVVLTILDEGPGIPEDLIGQAFEPFFRVDMARRKTVPGAGLGLAIAREIIERFGGGIRMSNRLPSGLAQVVELPAARCGDES